VEGRDVQLGHQEALRILTDAEEIDAASSVLQWERWRHAQALGITGPWPVVNLKPQTAWEHLLVGRSLFWSGQHAKARAEFNQSVALDPRSFWAHFYQAVAAYEHGDARDAVQAFSVCVALSPQTAVCYFNRGLAQAQLGLTEQAEQDYAHALELDPGLTASQRFSTQVRSKRVP
jgi:tetratricopeptide (TPR) repeat protein